MSNEEEQAYIEVLSNSALSFKKMWEEEVAERKKIQGKYDELTRQIKKQAVDKILEREVSEINIPVNEKYMTLLRQGTSVSFPVCCSLEGIRSLKLTPEEVNAREVSAVAVVKQEIDRLGTEIAEAVVRAEFGKLVQERLDDDEEDPIRMDTADWDDERMDVIGQNGNDGLHYEEISDEQKAQNLKEYLERLAAFDEYEKDGM